MQYDDELSDHPGHDGFYWGYASQVNFWLALSVLGLALYMAGLLTGRIQLDFVEGLLRSLDLDVDSWQFLLFVAAVLGLLSLAVLRPILPMAIFVVVYLLGLGIVGVLYVEFLAEEFGRMPAWSWFVLQPGVIAALSFLGVSVLGLFDTELGESGRGDGLWTFLCASLLSGLLMIVHYAWAPILPVFPDAGSDPTYFRHFFALMSWTIIALLGEAFYKFRRSYEDYRHIRPPIKEAAGVMIATLWLMIIIMLIFAREFLRAWARR